MSEEQIPGGCCFIMAIGLTVIVALIVLGIFL
jgi:hypothetical protein